MVPGHGDPVTDPVRRRGPSRGGRGLARVADAQRGAMVELITPAGGVKFFFGKRKFSINL